MTQAAQQKEGFFGWLKSLLGFTDIDMGLAQVDEDAGKQLTIIYGTQTGNAQTVAEGVATQAKSIGLDVALRDMEDVDVAKFKEIDHLIVVTSTFDNGGMPENAELLWESICDPSAPMLTGLRYAVLGLGDSSYFNFCMAGKEWDARLEGLGGVQIAERVDCDVDYEVPAQTWVNQVLPIIADKYGITVDASTMPMPIVNLSELGNNPESADANHANYANSTLYHHNRHHPFTAKLLKKRVLTAPNSTKEIVHYEFDISDAGENYREGDILHVIPQNRAELVDEVLAYFNVDKQDGQLTDKLINQLTTELEIRTPSRELVELVASRAHVDELRKILANKDPEALESFLWGKDSLELICSYADGLISLEDFMSSCKPLLARAYSISSSPSSYSISPSTSSSNSPKQVHITVRSVRYANDEASAEGRQHNGVASTYLADVLNEGEAVSCYFSANKSFKLPEDANLPIIMVGPGTGIAPFRAFLQARKAQRQSGATGDNWLFFGERNQATDFIYEDEIIAMQNEGVLTKLSLAFSRDQAQKVYVQDRMHEQGAELFAWLERGGYFYVCGDAQYMAKDVDRALYEVVAKHGKMTDVDALEYVHQLQREKRYVKDVY